MVSLVKWWLETSIAGERLLQALPSFGRCLLTRPLLNSLLDDPVLVLYLVGSIGRPPRVATPTYHYCTVLTRRSLPILHYTTVARVTGKGRSHSGVVHGESEA